MRTGWLVGVFLAGAVCCCAPAARAQMGQGSMAEPPSGPSFSPLGWPPFRTRRLISDHQMREMNALRQKKILSDTDKLVALVQEVQDSMQQAGPPPSDLSKKLEEIEKLAHSVRSKEIQ